MNERAGDIKNSKENDPNIMAMIYCPFFGWLKHRHISCEFLGQPYAISLRFKSASQKYRILFNWCIPPDGNLNCPIAVGNIKYWERKNAKKKP
jgi:hypothetical protein